MVRTSQRRSWGEKGGTHLFTALAITTMHFPPLLLIPHHGTVRIIQSAICIRINLERSIDCFGLGSRVNGQQDK